MLLLIHLIKYQIDSKIGQVNPVITVEEESLHMISGSEEMQYTLVVLKCHLKKIIIHSK